MDNGPKPSAGAEDVAVLRGELDPEPVLLPPGGAAFIEALQAGNPLGRAFEAGIGAAAEFDLSQSLAVLLSANAITDIGDVQ